MNIRIQIFLIICTILAFLGIMRVVRRRKTDLKYVLPWIIMDLMAFIFILWPELLEKAANILGITLPSNMILFFGLCCCLVLLFYLTIVVSRLSERMKVLTQELALLEKKIER